MSLSTPVLPLLLINFGAQVSFASCLHFQKLDQPQCTPTHTQAVAQTGTQPLLAFYRLLSAGDEHRQCRLHPTCSGFLISAWQTDGPIAFLWTAARIQMEHSDQDGFLHRRLASDGLWIYDDSAQLWEHSKAKPLSLSSR